MAGVRYASGAPVLLVDTKQVPLGDTANPLVISATLVSTTNLSIGPNGVAVPLDSTQIGGPDGGGLLRAAQVLNVAPAGAEYGIVTRGVGAALDVTLTNGTQLAQVAGTGTAGAPAAGVVTIQGVGGMTPVAISGTVSATNPSVGTNGAAIPTSSTQVGGTDGANLQPWHMTSAGAGRVEGALTNNGAAPGATNVGVLPVIANAAAPALTEGRQALLSTDLAGGLRVLGINTLGQKTMANSTPVVLASDQTSIPVAATLQAGSAVIGHVITDTGSTTVVTGSVTVIGAAASGVAKSGNPVQVGAVFNTTQPTVTTGQVVEAQATARGAHIVATGVDTFNVTVNAALPAGANVIGHVITDTGSTTAVTGTVTVSGTVTANQGTAAATASAWPLKVTDGTNVAAVKAASTAAAATDPALVVAISPNNTVAVTSTQLPAALVGGRLDENIGAWLGSTAPTVGQKAMASSVPVVIASDQTAVPVSGTVTITPSGTQTVAGNKTNNNAAPGATNVGALVAIANAAIQTWTEGDQVLLSTDLTGALRITGSVSATNPSVSTTGAAVPASATMIGGTDGTNLQTPFVMNSVPAGTEYGLVVRVEGLPAGAALSDATANPTTVMVGAANMGWNGANWERVDSGPTNSDGIAVDTAGQLETLGFNLMFNGTSWDRVRGSVANGLSVSGVKTSNTVVPDGLNLGVLPAVANANAPKFSEGFQGLLSVDLDGNLRTRSDANQAYLTGRQQDLLEQILVELRYHSVALQQGLWVRDDPQNFRNESSNLTTNS